MRLSFNGGYQRAGMSYKNGITARRLCSFKTHPGQRLWIVASSVASGQTNLLGRPGLMLQTAR